MPLRLIPPQIDDDLPDEVRAALSAEHDAQTERFRVFAQAIAAKRDEAVKGRQASGIEDVWTEAEEAYAGIDDANRAELGGAASWRKPTTMSGGLERRRADPDGKPTGFVRLTARYVDAGAAKAAEITIPVDGKAFALKASPVQDADKLLQDESQITANGVPQMRPATPEDAPPAMPGQEPQQAPKQVPLRIRDLVRQAVAEAEESAQAASDRIHDWLVECGHAAELRKVIFDGARLGAGVLKGPVPEMRRSSAVTRPEEGVVALEMREKVAPVTRWVDPWNLFPDPACGENVHDGDYIIERDHLVRGKLEGLKGSGLYLDDAIDLVLAEGPKSPAAHKDSESTQGKMPFEVWHFYGRISREDLELLNESAAGTIGKDDDGVFAIVTMVNDTPIRVALNPLHSGSFPYHVFSWRRRADHWAGVGVAEQLRFPQRLINGATRAMMTNAALSAGGILAVNDDMLVPPGGSWRLTPNMILRLAPEASLEDIRKAIATFSIPNATPQLLQVIEYALRLAEESTNIPLISQGQSGKTTPDTFGGQQLQDNNANQLLRDVGYAIADGITNPLVKQLYEWLLVDPDVPEHEKGDHQVDVNGAMALIDKAIQDQTLMMLGQLAPNPAFGLSPERWMEMMLRSKRINPAELRLTDEEKAQAAQNQQPPPQIAVAQIRAQSAEKIAQSRDQLAAQRNENDLDRDTRYGEMMAARELASAQARIEELHLKRELALLEYATQERVTLAQVKSDLAQTAMKLRVQKELSSDGSGPQVATPVVEPEGRAPEGKAFER